ncbi:MAG: transcription elongation factor GreA [Candidatus Improbicoccus pseudotrichonymphae]|uniref:Transcription elongation factor GreA n=1 Tax=Candidatus Improbicoccus pseudotrichonymphae TaxID=3033792 RepID=A0AA48IAZ4_9FIRM|nr:MAG: transcription elongation factor GreA [Candidatus Improbicoccus pseudotrichonymphae]
MEKQVLLTKDGLEKLESELKELKTVKRKEVSQRIKVALSFGDLSENSEYDEAKNEQALTEVRIVEIEKMLKNAKIIDEDKLNVNVVHVGCKVKIRKLETEIVNEYKIVGSSEANPVEFKISDESPVGAGLLGKTKGKIVDIKTPSGIQKYEIVEISK